MKGAPLAIAALVLAVPFFALPAHAFAATQVFLTTTGTGSWAIPIDWNSSNNTIEAIGAGGVGGSTQGSGGGAYAKISNLALTYGNPNVSYQVGISSQSGTTGDSWFSSTGTLLAKSTLSSSGGSAASSVGSTTFSGGAGGTVSGSRGGGGAAGPHGAGATGSATGGTADNGFGGTGGSGSSTGNTGTEWDATHGSGGGGGTTGGQGGKYGGGAGAGLGQAPGGDGIIVITYTPIVAPTCTLTASRSLIPSGATVALTWTTANTPTSASIDNGVGSVATGGGTTNVSPTTTTTYTLTVTNTGGSNTCTTTVSLDGDKIIFLTSTTSSPWTVPPDWNNASNTIEVIGAGGAADTFAYQGGGGYSKKVNLSLTPGDSVSYQVGIVSIPSYATNNTSDTWFSSTSVVMAKGSADSSHGGLAADGVGDVKYSGGAQGGGGGGAAGPHGNGADGDASLPNGGAGDAGYGGTGGLGAAASHDDRNGGNGTEWDALHGAGGGGGYNESLGGCGGLYGGGGSSSPEGQGCDGAQGLIVITYTPASPSPTCTFTATPSNIIKGAFSTLSWTTTNATSTTIDNGVGSVATSSGSTSVSPPTTTTYTLSVTGNNLTNSCTATVSLSKSNATIFGGHTTIGGGGTTIR